MSKLSVNGPCWLGTQVPMDEMLEYVRQIIDRNRIHRIHYTFDTVRDVKKATGNFNFYARVTYVFTGQLATTAAFDGKIGRKLLQPGDFLVSNAGGWDYPERTEDCRALAILFFPVHIRLVFSEFRNGRVEENPYCHSPAPAGDNLNAILGVISRIMTDPLADRDGRVGPLLSALLHELLVELDPSRLPPLTAQHRHVERIRSFMIHNCHLPISCAEVADALKLNRTYASGLFTEYMNVTMKEYLLRLRMEKAAAILSTGLLGVGETAKQCGFGSTSYFIYRFRCYYGTTPVVFAQQPHPYTRPSNPIG